MEKHGENSLLTVPLSFGGKPLGMLTLTETAAERVFHQNAELDIARGLGEQAAEVALHNARLFENVKALHLRQPEGPELGAHCQGLLHCRPHGTRRRIRDASCR